MLDDFINEYPEGPCGVSNGEGSWRSECEHKPPDQ